MSRIFPRPVRQKRLHLVDSNFRKLGDQVPRPAIDVVFLDDVPHAPHARLAFVCVHFKRHADCVRHLIGIVGVDDQRIAQFAGRARELAQDERAFFVLARGHEFLGHQIHAVV